MVVVNFSWNAWNASRVPQEKSYVERDNNQDGVEETAIVTSNETFFWPTADGIRGETLNRTIMRLRSYRLRWGSPGAVVSFHRIVTRPAGENHYSAAIMRLGFCPARVRGCACRDACNRKQRWRCEPEEGKKLWLDTGLTDSRLSATISRAYFALYHRSSRSLSIYRSDRHRWKRLREFFSQVFKHHRNDFIRDVEWLFPPRVYRVLK